MRNRVLLSPVLAAAALAVVPLAGAAAEAHAPPTLSPIVAHNVADACPGTDAYARALVQGIARADAVAARPLFAACAAESRLPEFRWKTDVANVALGAVDLSLGVIDRDAAALQRANAETRDLRSLSPARDDEVREWTFIPDYLLPGPLHGPMTFAYLPVTPANAQIARRPNSDDATAENAAYVNVAARAGTAWITEPRRVGGTSFQAPPFRNDPTAKAPRSNTATPN
jgi:hypothetical protein